MFEIEGAAMAMLLGKTPSSIDKGKLYLLPTFI